MNKQTNRQTQTPCTHTSINARKFDDDDGIGRGFEVRFLPFQSPRIIVVTVTVTVTITVTVPVPVTDTQTGKDGGRSR
jgi:hypothetical protein